jgi:hydrogenase 3 maturation protease
MLNLKDILKGRVVILCVGNIERGDDGVGPHLARLIKGNVVHEVIDAGTTPENHTGVIKRLRPDVIVIVDAIYFEGRPGEIRLFSGEELRSGKISTHDVSPKLLIEYLRSCLEAEIYILGIRPGSNKLGEGLSKDVEEAAKRAEALFSPSPYPLPKGERVKSRHDP